MSNVSAFLHKFFLRIGGNFAGGTPAIYLAAAVLAGSLSCANPMTVDAALRSPSGSFVAEVISHDASAVTGVERQREFVVLLREPREERSFEGHTVLRILGAERPSLRWTTDSALEVELGNGMEIVEDKTKTSKDIVITVSRGRRSESR